MPFTVVEKDYVVGFLRLRGNHGCRTAFAERLEVIGLGWADTPVFRLWACPGTASETCRRFPGLSVGQENPQSG